MRHPAALAQAAKGKVAASVGSIVRTFKTIEELRAELVAFARSCTWLVARHGYKTPARVREEQTTPRIAIDPTLAATLPLAA